MIVTFIITDYAKYLEYGLKEQTDVLQKIIKHSMNKILAKYRKQLEAQSLYYKLIGE